MPDQTIITHSPSGCLLSTPPPLQQHQHQPPQPLRVCVFGSSSKHTHPRYVQEGVRLGELIAKAGFLCVNGAGSAGCMGGVNKGCDTFKGAVRGVIHEKFCVDFGEHPHISDLVMTRGSDLSERKQALLDNADCVIVLPGGVGTFDEFWDAVCGKSLGMKGLEAKPIVLVNVHGFYDGFLLQMQRAYEDGILYGKAETYYHVENDVEAALNYCVQAIRCHSEQIHTQLLIDHIKENNINSNGEVQEEQHGEHRVKKRSSPHHPISTPTTITTANDEGKQKQHSEVDPFLAYRTISVAFIVGIAAGTVLHRPDLLLTFMQ
eukprot:gene5852-6447_t